MKEINKSRRDFLSKSALAAAAFSIVPRFVLGGKGHIPPSDQLTKGIIGVGSMGRNHIPYEGTRVVAICDVDKAHIELAKKIKGKFYSYVCKTLKPLNNIL